MHVNEGVSMKLKQRLLAVIGAAALAITTLFTPAVQVEAASPIFESQDYTVLTNIIGAVESGGQVYGQRNYAAYAGQYANSNKEYTCTLGWAQYYGAEAKRLIQRIYNADPAGFKKIDTNGVIQKKLSVDWVATRWNPSSTEKNLLIKLITTDVGKAQQDAMFMEVMTPFVKDCAATYTNNIQATMMYCEIRHLGGKGPVDRIFKRCNGNYSVDNILASLKKDQNDTSNNNQVGDAKFNSRHQKCAEWVKKYARTSSSGSSSGSSTITIKDYGTAPAGMKYVYRVYNSRSGEHLYTTSNNERTVLIRSGWTDEGIGWTAPSTSSVPVYRVYNSKSGEHLYTKDSNERRVLVSMGWNDEGISFYSDTNQTRAVYREYNPKGKNFTHNYTADANEHKVLTTTYGWVNEGICWYAAQ